MEIITTTENSNTHKGNESISSKMAELEKEKETAFSKVAALEKKKQTALTKIDESEKEKECTAYKAAFLEMEGEIWKKFLRQVAEEKATEWCSIWHTAVEDPGMIDKEDKNLQLLREEWGYEAYSAVVVALTGRNQRI
ncbi:hypothetical protein HAX54_044169 [Datura stramonium]|uniref:Uncharacterized protein n=1 Tax=Datura stramonium TaxID=4076 RepID=A0ABS8RR69_DATST|nr:hypothetical protein [Datura stramonium]